MRSFLFFASLLVLSSGWRSLSSNPANIGLPVRDKAVMQTGTDPVFVTQSGTKYHHCHCRMVENPIMAFPSVAAARQSGYTPYQFCAGMIGQDLGPCPDQHIKILRGERPTPAAIQHGRCQAKTQRGTQCLHNNNGVSNYCWQHSR